MITSAASKNQVEAPKPNGHRSDRKLRIAYAIQNVGGIDFTQDVGDTVPVKHTLTGLRKHGHEVTCFQLRERDVVTFEDFSSSDDIIQTPLRLSDNKLFLKFEGGVRRLQQMLRLPYFAFFDTFRFYEACYGSLPKYDLCHEHNGLFCIGAAIACRRLGIPYVLTFSADLFMERALVDKGLRGAQAKIAAQEAKFTYQFARKIICVSNSAKRHLQEVWQVNPEKIVVLPNGVDIDLFQPRKRDKQLSVDLGLDHGPVITFVGGFQPWHGLDSLVEAFAGLLNEIPSANLLLVGDGRARPLVEQAVHKFGLEKKVTVTGLVPQTRIPEILGITDVAVMPYPKLPKELWFSPLKMYEYMAAGCAIVASKDGQISEVIQDGQTGILVEPGEVNDLSRALISLINNPIQRKRLGLNARQQAVQHHSWEKYIERLEAVYLSAIQPSRDDQ